MPRNESHLSYMKSDGVGSSSNNDRNGGVNTDMMETTWAAALPSASRTSIPPAKASTPI